MIRWKKELNHKFSSLLLDFNRTIVSVNFPELSSRRLQFLVDKSLQAFKALAACNNNHLQISVKLKEDCLDQSHNSHKQLDLELKEHLGNNNQHKICLELPTHSKQSLAKILVSNLEISLMLSKSRRSLKLKTNPLSLNQHLDQQLKASVFNLVSRHHKLLIALHSVEDLELQHQTSMGPF